MCSIDDLFVGCPVRSFCGWVEGFVLQIANTELDPNILVSNYDDPAQWFYSKDLEIILWEKPEKVSRLIHKQMIDEVSNG